MIPLVQGMTPPISDGIELDIEVNLQYGCIYVYGQNPTKDLFFAFMIPYRALVGGLNIDEAQKALCHLVYQLKNGDDPEANQHQDMPSWAIH